MRSEFCILYLDDVTHGENVEDLTHDLRVFQQEAAELGLQLNQRKSEIICNDSLVPSSIQALIPNAAITDPNIASPIGNIESTSKVIVEKARLLEIVIVIVILYSAGTYIYIMDEKSLKCDDALKDCWRNQQPKHKSLQNTTTKTHRYRTLRTFIART